MCHITLCFNDSVSFLSIFRYTGPLLDNESLSVALEQGPRSTQYVEVVVWLVEQLRSLCGLEENVNTISSPDDAAEFVMELSGVLRELKCPFKHLYEGGPVTERLGSRTNTVQLLDYLTSELQATKMLSLKRPSALMTPSPMETDSSSQHESDIAKHLKMMCIALGFPKPPPNITSAQLFNKVEAKVKELITQNPNQIGKPLLKARLSDKQWAQLMKINDSLTREYTTRREMILKRLDVTVQSFMWSDTAKRKENEIAAIYQPIRKLLTAKCSLGVPQILAARDDLTRLNKTSSGDAREKTKCAINKVLIPRVVTKVEEEVVTKVVEVATKVEEEVVTKVEEVVTKVEEEVVTKVEEVVTKVEEEVDIKVEEEVVTKVEVEMGVTKEEEVIEADLEVEEGVGVEVDIDEINIL
ncbi:hypothetical protein FSP39_007657 [Pinctada imbricata]|uniref:Protein FAM98A n=1 Tax=Pinctada imbricata TaxID=66713 RepID=A0AA88XZ01_PINIB|nr:hypothetical protein FSP39_007657 [Pinctada imbricata]